MSIIGDLNSRCGKRSDILQNCTDFDRFIHVLDENEYCINESNFPHRFSMDETVNTSGIKLLDICRSSSLKIVNGRCGDDAGIGGFTNMSSNGNSLIDYVICSYELFPFISEFIVHDVYTCSTHAPIQISFDVFCENVLCNNVISANVCKLRFKEEKLIDYKNIMSREMPVIGNIVDSIISSDIDLDSGISDLSSILYDKAFSIFGSNKHIYKDADRKSERKFQSPWFNEDCENARRELRLVNKKYRYEKSPDNVNLLIINRRCYKQTKRKAISHHKQNQKHKLHELSKKQPQKFWSEIKKLKSYNKNSSTLSKDDFFNHFKELFTSLRVVIFLMMKM